jgi:hypothetical protein
MKIEIINKEFAPKISFRYAKNSVSVDFIYECMKFLDLALIEKTLDKDLPLILHDIVTDEGGKELERRLKN